MLTDAKLRALKPAAKLYKVADRDGLYAAVLVSGVVSFRFNYRINGRQETLALGCYGPGGLTLAEARSRLETAKKKLAEGASPSREKGRQRTKAALAESFHEWADLWLRTYSMAESTRDMRRSVYERDLKLPFGKLKLWEITHDDLRSLCDRIVARGAPATAVHARDVVLIVFRFASERGRKYPNPADLVRPHSIATFQPRDRSLTADEIRLAYEFLEHVATTPIIRLAVKLLLLTMLRKSELIQAEWSEINFNDALWTIPAKRMKRRNPHNVYLSRQTLDIFVALKTCAGGSRFVLPSRYDPDKHMSQATLNQVISLTVRAANEDGKPLAEFSPERIR